MTDPYPPSRGERNAIIGFKPQYEIAAIKILRAIREGILEAIRIADPGAGRVDDFQILTPNRIDAFQVKWSEHPSLVTYKDLTSPKTDEKPCLIAQLADGWKRLKESYFGRRVVVHLVMRDRPSPNKATIPATEQKPEQYHFAGFVSQVWDNAHRAQRGSIFRPPIEWEPAWDAFQEASGLESDEEFNEFVRDCKLEFGYEIPSYEELQINDRILLKDQIATVAKKLFDLVADPGASTEYTTKEFLQLLGWSNNIQLLNLHDFPVDEDTYKQIEGLDEEFERLINSTTQGYIAIIGTPGSGKSTFLTQILKNRKERIVKYYSFIPDSFESINLRGEAKNFLHDITIQLEREGFTSGGSISSFDRNVLLKRFHDQLQFLHTAWKEEQRKTIFLIDGLDHIQREQHPEYSLLNDLPSPETIPEGIVFVLGSQTDEIFPSRIKSKVRNGHKIEMRPLSRQAVTEIVNGSSLQTSPTLDQISKIYSLSDGHPLALNYIINRICDAQSTEEIATILKDSKRYSGNIEQQYQSYWDEISADSRLFELLGLIARCKSDIDLDWFEIWYDPTAIIELRRKFSHYFKRDGRTLWRFFHNSFRIFVIIRTSEDGQGSIDDQRSSHYHRVLAEQSIKQPDCHIHAWDEIYHRYYAKQYQEIVDLATYEYFRNQFLSFRAITEIQGDLNLALSSAKMLKNLTAFFRLILIGSEYEQRQNHLDQISYYPLLFKLHKSERKLCLNHIMSGNSLRIDQKKALAACEDLIYIDKQSAKQIFYLSEPFDILIASEPIQDFQRYQPELLYSWAIAAPYFREVKEIVDLVKKCKQTDFRLAYPPNDDGVTGFQKDLLYRAAFSFIALEQWDDLKVIIEELELYPKDAGESDEFNLYYWSWNRCIHRHQYDEARFFLQKGIKLIGNSYLSPDTADFSPRRIIRLAKGIFQIYQDTVLVNQYLQHLSLSENVQLNFDTVAFSNPRMVFSDYADYIETLFYLGGTYKPFEDIISTGKQTDELLTDFQRHVYTISYISALGDINTEISVSQIEELVSPILKFYYKDYHIFHYQTEGTLIHRTREDLFKFLVNSVAKHGNEAIRSFCNLLDDEWANPDNEKYWSSKVWENFITILYLRGAAKEWCIDKLSCLKDSILERPNEYYDTYARVHEYYEYAEAWSICGDDAKCKKSLARTLQTSFGIGFRKDYQLNSWIEWLNIINSIEPEERVHRTLYFARIVSLLHGYVEKRADVYAAEGLISITFDWSPGRALILAKWFTDIGVFSDDYARDLFLSLLLQRESYIPAGDIIPFVDLMLLSDEILETHKRIMEASIIRSIKWGEPSVDTIIKHLLDSIELYCGSAQKYQWLLNIAEIIDANAIDPRNFNLNLDELKEAAKSNNSSVSGLDKEIPEELLQRPVEPEVLIQKIPGLKYHYTWEPIVFDIVSTYSKEQIQKVLSVISDNSDLCVVLSRRLLDLNDLSGAKQVAIKAINECRWGGYGLPSDHGAKVEALKIIMQIDSDLGREIALRMLFDDLTKELPYFYTISIKMDSFMPNLAENSDQIRQMWEEIEEYLRQILSEYKLPLEIPDKFLDEIENDTIEATFAEYQKIF
ncbi:MAG: ATP-binding protein [Eubacteriales bacterium]|nr:ATP-binding protein [Eubacteriales bacterium]